MPMDAAASAGLSTVPMMAGIPITRFEYRDGQESGRQQMWTANGTLRANCGGVYHATIALDMNQIQRDALLYGTRSTRSVAR